MPRISDKRERLVEAAKTLIHQQGYNQTTLADIARESDVPLGNVYYYFKTKDDIGAAVIDERIEDLRTVMREWERNPDPRQRLVLYLGMVNDMREEVVKYGCPVGSLCQELNKDCTSLSDKADEIIKTQLKWVTEQFHQMGKDDAVALGHQFLAALQGASLLASTLNDPGVVVEQVKRMEAWLRNI